jgi:riboflavin synthase
MFTGIVTDIGTVRRIEKRGDWRLEIETDYDVATIEIGASIACSGPCLTVVAKGPGKNGARGWFAVDASAETLDKTTIGKWTEGRLVNLERALKVGDELGGHIVSGHVDGVGRIEAIEPEGDSLRFRFSAPADLMPYIASKGSIAIDGISLTVNEVGDEGFGVNIIPHTQSVTALRDAKAGDPVNLEIDILARYVARLNEAEKGRKAMWDVKP